MTRTSTRARSTTALSATAAAVLALVLAPATSQATQIQAVYQFSAQDFLDSNFDPPMGSTSTTAAGTFGFTFNDAALPDHEIVPTSVLGVDLTYFDGTMMDFDETNSGVDVDFGNLPGEARITFGGTITGGIAVLATVLAAWGMRSRTRVVSLRLRQRRVPGLPASATLPAFGDDHAG